MTKHDTGARALACPEWLRPSFEDSRVGALMTTRAGGVSAAPFDTMNVRHGIGDDAAAVARNHALLADAIEATPVWLDQVHGVRVVRLTAASVMQPRATADASITTERGLACAIQTADCLPVLFAAPWGVGAAHAGWRGLSAGVLEATLDALCSAANCLPGDIRAWLGPCIGPRRFEVGVDVLRAFGAETSDADGRRFTAHAPAKWLADLQLLARDRLERSGLVRIMVDETCTVEDASRFFSFRRDRVTGRMAAAIWLR